MKPIYKGYIKVPVYQIPVQVLQNDNDWTFTLLDMGDGVKQLAVF